MNPRPPKIIIDIILKHLLVFISTLSISSAIGCIIVPDRTDFNFVGGKKILPPYTESCRASNPYDENVSLDYAGSCHRTIANLHRDPTILCGRVTEISRYCKPHLSDEGSAWSSDW